MSVYDVPCDHWTGDPDTGARCGATPTRLFLPGRRCADHQPARVAGREPARPDPARTITGLREAKGLPPLPVAPPPAAATQVLEDRHVASGKRRSSPAAYREAKARVAARATDSAG